MRRPISSLPGASDGAIHGAQLAAHDKEVHDISWGSPVEFYESKKDHDDDESWLVWRL